MINPDLSLLIPLPTMSIGRRSIKKETLVKSLSGYVTALNIVISWLGFLGLVIFTAEQRTKEFRNRKVLGASVLQIVNVLSKDFLILVGVAFLIATRWRTILCMSGLTPLNIASVCDGGFFAIAAGSAVTVTLLTIASQALKIRNGESSKKLAIQVSYQVIACGSTTVLFTK